jgi:hypothetical protein
VTEDATGEKLAIGDEIVNVIGVRGVKTYVAKRGKLSVIVEAKLKGVAIALRDASVV